VLPPQALIALAAQLVMMGGCFVLSLYLTINLQAKICHFRFLCFGDLRTLVTSFDNLSLSLSLSLSHPSQEAISLHEVKFIVCQAICNF
jgi:hypothetical protein